MAAPAVETVSTVADFVDANNQIDVSKPTGTVEDDLLVYGLAAHDAQSAAITGITPPTGFTELDEIEYDSSFRWAGWGYKVAGGSEPSSYTFELNDSFGVCAIGLRRISGVDTTTPIDVSDFSTLSSGSSRDCPSVTTTVDDTLLLRDIACTDSTVTSPSGLTEDYNEQVQGNFGLTSTAGGAHETQASSGSTGTAAWTGVSSSIDTRTATIAIKPAAGGGSTDDLTADDLATGNPTLDTPSLGQTHNLTATDLSTTPTLDSPAVGQEHGLTGDDLASGAPTLGTPAITEVTALTADDLATAAPTLTVPEIGQAHALSSPGVTATPVLDTPALGQAHALDATDLATQAPSLTSPALSEANVLTANDLTAGTPTLDSPAIGQTHALTGADVSTTPALDSPVLGQTHGLTGADLIAGTPTLDTPVLSGGIPVFAVPRRTGFRRNVGKMLR